MPNNRKYTKQVLKQPGTRYSSHKPRAIEQISRYLQKELSMDKETAKIIATTCVKAIRETIKRYGCISIERTTEIVIHYVRPKLYNDKTDKKNKIWTLPKYVAIARISRHLNRELLVEGIPEPRMYESVRADFPGPGPAFIEEPKLPKDNKE